MQQKHKIKSSWYGKTTCKNSVNLNKLVYCKEAGFPELWTTFQLWKAAWEVTLADDRLLVFPLFWHNKINAIAKEEFMCLKFKVNWLAILFCKDVSTGRKKPLKNSSWKFWRQTPQTQVQQRSQMPTENDVRGSVTFQEKVFSFSVLKLKYLNTKVDKLTKQNHNI